MLPTKLLYKKTAQTDLHLYLFDSLPKQQPSAAIVFFVCGGWQGFNAQKLYPQATYFATRGIRVFVAEVRSINQHKTTPKECVVDAKSSIRWVREHAAEHNINPDTIVASGGSASGHVSLCSALISGFEEPDENQNISSKPNYLCIFNPVVSIFSSEKRSTLFGENAQALNPLDNITIDLPPTLIMQGDQDEITPLSDAQEFMKRCQTKARHQPKLIVYDQEGHGFFNWFDGKNKRFFETVRDMDIFLTEHHLLKGPPTIDESFKWVGPDDLGTV